MTESLDLVFEYKKGISLFWLNFKDESLEKKYQKYITEEKLTPNWFKWLMWFLVLLIAIRTILSVVQEYLDHTTGTDKANADLVTMIVMGASALLELFLYFCKNLKVLRGLPIFVGGFMHSSYDSYYSYPSSACLRPL